MKTILASVALSLLLPAAAYAQAAPAPAGRPKMECCCKDKPMACCKEHGEPDKAGHDEHDTHEPGPPKAG